MTPDPLPVALPELPTVAYQDPHCPSDLYLHARHWELTPLVRKSDAEAALRAQAEEVERLRALLLDARLFAASCPADMVRGSLNGMRVQLLHAIDAHLKDKP